MRIVEGGRGRLRKVWFFRVSKVSLGGKVFFPEKDWEFEGGKRVERGFWVLVVCLKWESNRNGNCVLFWWEWGISVPA